MHHRWSRSARKEVHDTGVDEWQARFVAMHAFGTTSANLLCSLQTGSFPSRAGTTSANLRCSLQTGSFPSGAGTTSANLWCSLQTGSFPSGAGTTSADLGVHCKQAASQAVLARASCGSWSSMRPGAATAAAWRQSGPRLLPR